jgi:hypothetical protein
MNDKFLKIYYIVGIIQRITMIVLTFSMMGVAYKIYDLVTKYGIEIKEIHLLVEKFYRLIDKSWFF